MTFEFRKVNIIDKAAYTHTYTFTYTAYYDFVRAKYDSIYK